MNKYISDIEMKSLIIKIVVGIFASILFCIFIIYMYNMSKKEDPNSIEIKSCELFRMFKEDVTKSEKNFNVIKTLSVDKQDIDISSNTFSIVTSESKILSSLVKAKEIFENIDHYDEINNINTFCIPSGVQASGMKNSLKDIKRNDMIQFFPGLDELEKYLSLIDTVEEYSWIREYKKYFSDKKYEETNVVLKVNNKILHLKSTKDDSMIPKWEQEVLLYIVEN